MIKCAGFNTIDGANRFLNDCKRNGTIKSTTMIVNNDENGRGYCYYKIARDFAGINTKYCLMWIA